MRPGRTRPWPSSESRRPRASAARVAAGKSQRVERRDVQPAGRLRQHRHVVGQPGVAERADLHLAVLAVVADREARGRRPRHVLHGRPERDERRQQLLAVGGGAACVDARLGTAGAGALGRRGRGRRRPAAAAPGRGRARGFRAGRSRTREYGPPRDEPGESREAERGEEARQRRAAPRQRVRIGVLDEPRPPARARPGRATGRRRSRRARRASELGAPASGAPKMSRALVAAAGEQPVGEQHAEQGHEERARAGTGTAGSCAGRSAARRRSRRPRSPRRGAAAARRGSRFWSETAPE